MDTLSPIVKERIEQAKSRASRKSFDAKELKGETVNRFYQSEDFRNRFGDFAMSKTPKQGCHSDSGRPGTRAPKASSSIREKKIREAKEKRQRGYYNDPEILSKVAQRLIDLFET
jgi:hypothetical protein